MTSIVTGVNDKTVTWSSDGGTMVGTNPCIVNEPCTIALTTTNPGTYHLTATSNANGSVAATSTITFTGSPTPTTTHPRLVITAAMLPGLQAKATEGNPIYKSIQTRASNALATDNSIWSWSCQQGTGKPSSNQISNYKEQDAYLFAFMSLVDPSPVNRAAWGCYGRDIMVYMMNAVLNNSSTPIDGPYGLTGNRGSDSTAQFTLTVDWLMGGTYLNSSDLAMARNYFAWIGQNMITTAYTGSRGVVGNYNSSAQFLTGSIWDFTGQRAMGNNYTHSKEMYLVAAALTFNDTPSDDPATGSTCGAGRYVVCPDGTAGSLHAYWTYLAGGVLYKDWAHVEDPNVSWQAYQAKYANLPTQPSCNNTWSSTPVPCFGEGRGGESVEGSWYRYSLYRSRYALNAIHTAGYDDPILYGPQLSYGTSSWWDLHYVAELSFLTGTYGTDAVRWAYWNTGDTLAYYRTPSDYEELASTMVFDSYSGRTDRTKALEWPILNVAFGGPSNLVAELSNDYGSPVAVDLFISLPAADPAANPPADPRLSLPTDIFDAGNQHILARSGWTPTDTAFSYYCANTAVDHEHGYCGRFDIFSNGEYVTKGRTEFNNYNDLMSATSQSNLASYMQPFSSTCASNSCYMYDAYSSGGQFWHSYQAGQATLLHNEAATYVAAIVDTTNLYNASATGGFGYYNGVRSASRSLIYLRGSNQVVYYDRGSTAAAQSHSLWQVTTGPLSIQGRTASWPTRSGSQKAYFTSLLPSSATVADAGEYTEEAYPQNSDWEPFTRVVVNAGTTTSTQFLSVLEWGNSGLSQSSKTLVQSSTGTTFDGAVVGSSLVMFMRNWPATFTSVTYAASGAKTHYVSDLIPNTTYAISGPGTPASATTDTAGVLTFSATGIGSITIGTGTSGPTVTGITIAPFSASVIISGAQRYTATCHYSDGSAADCTSSVTWSSSARSVVTIDGSGLATGVAQGNANITATSGPIYGQAGVTVPATTLQSIAVAPSTLTVSQGDTQQFTATGTYSDSSTSDLTSSVAWSSSNTTMASVSAAGLVAGVAPGTASISASSSNIQGKAVVSVPAQTPVFSPAGGTYNSTQTVTISTAVSSATIYYTTDGTTPTTGSQVYTGPITVPASETVQAVGAVKGYAAGAIGSATYTIHSPEAASLTFSPAGGTYTTAQTVSITSTMPEVVIHYTTDGSAAMLSSKVYTGPFTVSAKQTVNATVAIPGSASSVQRSANYIIILPAATPTFSPAGGTYSSTQVVAITTTTPAATIYYTTNGSTPTTNSAMYGGPITVSASETVNAIAASVDSSTSVQGSASYTIRKPVAATPGFSPAGGTYNSAQTLTIATTTPSATIYYTTNGSTPTTSSTVYTGPLPVSATETVQAIAVISGYSDSSANSAIYTINLPSAAPTFTPAGGTYSSAQTVSIATTTPSATIYYTTDGSTPTANSAAYAGPISVSATETVKAIAAATDYSVSSQGLASYTINLPMAAAPKFSLAGGTYNSAQTVSLSTTTPSATIYYTTNGLTPTTSSTAYVGPVNVATTETVQAIAVANDYTTSALSATSFTINQSSAAPSFSPAGGTYNSAQTVALSTTTPSATIYYTTNGATPSTNSAVYTGPIAVGATETVQAISLANGYTASSVGLAVYSINLPSAAMPVFSPAGGSYSSTQTVALTTTTPSAIIYYTTNGATPTTGSGAYTGPITVSGSETVNAIVVASGYKASAVSSANYTIDLSSVAAPLTAAAPRFSLDGGTYASTQTVMISTTTRPLPGAKASTSLIYYTRDGSTPTIYSGVYTGPITVSATETLKAFAVVSGYSPSPVGLASYTIQLRPSPTPAFAPASGNFSAPHTVRITTNLHSATIYYTTDGSTPTTRSAVFYGPINVSATETIRAISVLDGYAPSPVVSASYTISLASVGTPTVSVALSPATLTLAAGQSGTTAVFAVPQNGFASKVSFSCSGLPSGASCSFSPATAMPTDSAAASTLTIATASVVAASRHDSSPFLPGSALALCFCCIGRKRRIGSQMLMLTGAAIGTGLCSGCGSVMMAEKATVNVIASYGDMNQATTLHIILR